MARAWFSWNAVLGAAAFFFLLVQVRLFLTQSRYILEVSSVVRSENECPDRMRQLVDQLTVSQGKLSSLAREKDELQFRIDQMSGGGVEEFGLKEVEYGKGNPVAAVVIMACNRPDYLERTIKSVLKYHGAVAAKFPLFISQDGSHSGVEKMAKGFSDFEFMQHLDFQEPTPRPASHMLAYYKIASHYKWALTQLFDRHPRVIILEDDMEIARDFFDYFEATAGLLDMDRSLMAVSSWNDNGQRQFVQDSERLYRSDFFPGLGWMLKKDIWEELAPKWPEAYWDDWMRLSQQRKGRHFIRPEVCRTYNFGEHGSSAGQFFRQYLEPIMLNDAQVNWKAVDLTYLLEPNYTRTMGAILNEAMPISIHEAEREASHMEGDVRFEYTSQAMFEQVAKKFGVFEEWKDGVPRTSYKGVVVFRWQGSHRIFLVSSNSKLLEAQPGL